MPFSFFFSFRTLNKVHSIVSFSLPWCSDAKAGWLLAQTELGMQPGSPHCRWAFGTFKSTSKPGLGAHMDFSVCKVYLVSSRTARGTWWHSVSLKKKKKGTGKPITYASVHTLEFQTPVVSLSRCQIRPIYRPESSGAMMHTSSLASGLTLQTRCPQDKAGI